MDTNLLGHYDNLENLRTRYLVAGMEVGRVSAEHRERYLVLTPAGEYEAEITGKLRFGALGREDFPAVGDWVAIAVFDAGNAIIHEILPRFSVIKRESAGQSGEVQVIAANVDQAFLLQSADRDFNLNRMERYLAICHAAGVSPVIVLTKIDLVTPETMEGMISAIESRARHVPVVAVSNETLAGFDALNSYIRPGSTLCMLGSSGVGKSTLLNRLTGREMMKTEAISQSVQKGKHTTTHRHLVLLENGGILIDNPGMREVGMADSASGIDMTFDAIGRLAGQCRYKDCMHTGESGCAVIQAVNSGEIPQAAYENYLKLQKESSFFESSAAERARKDKLFGRMMKNYKKNQKSSGQKGPGF